MNAPTTYQSCLYRKTRCLAEFFGVRRVCLHPHQVVNAEGIPAPPARRGVFNALKTSGSYCFGYALKLPSSLQSSSVAESNGLINKTFYQKVFWLLFFKKVTASPVLSPLNTNLSSLPYEKKSRFLKNQPFALKSAGDIPVYFIKFL